MSVTVVVGASVAGTTVAQTLRDEGYDGRVVLVGDEPHLPYQRPPLSKGRLRGTDVDDAGAPTDTVTLHPEAWYAEHDVDLRRATRVTAVDRASGTVRLADGEDLPWDHLVLATGAEPRRLAVPGADLPGVHTLRTVQDSDRLRDTLVPGAHVVVVGGGWIGLEVAAVARERGGEVTVLEAGPMPLVRVLGPEIAPVITDLHRDHGVDVRTGVQVAALEGEERLTGVRLGDGSTLPADVVVVGVGVSPRTALAEAAGLEVANGVVVDELLRTSDPRVLAAGDIAHAWHPVLGTRVRVEHWATAVRHGETAARTIVGRSEPDRRLPFFFTDQYDLGMEYVGHVGPDGYDDVVVRGDLASRELIAFWLRDGRVLAGANINVWDVSEQIEELVVSGRRVDRARLAGDVPLDRL